MTLTSFETQEQIAEIYDWRDD